MISIRPSIRRKNSMGGFAVLFLYSILCSMLRISIALDIISPGKSLRDGDTLVSINGNFGLGFFSPTNSSERRYLAIWYNNIFPRTIIWVANREFPLSNNLGALNFTNQGSLLLLNSTNHVVWSSNATTTAQDPVVQLLDSGNLVVREGNVNNSSKNFLWQSFDYPCDTFIPGMKVGVNLVTGVDLFLSSWKSTEDPAHGQFSYRIDTRGYPQLVLARGSAIQYRVGSWNGLRFTGIPQMRPNMFGFVFGFVFNNSEVYLIYYQQNSSVFPRMTINPLGVGQLFIWNEQTNLWEVQSTALLDQCENYAHCGAYTNCDVSKSPVCTCLDGFVPKSPKWSDGCVRRTSLDCNGKNGTDGFWNYTGIKLPDTSSSWFDKAIDLKQCEVLCLKNCSCTAYASLDVRDGGSGCLLWFNHLIDMKKLTEGGDELYVRLAASELEKLKPKRPSSKKKPAGIIIGSVVLGTVMLILGIIFYLWRRNQGTHGMPTKSYGKNDNNKSMEDDLELPIFDWITIADATNNFSSSNMLGQGGFGPVYKGALIEGQEIAVKRLSKSSGQGSEEFRNEVILISKLQHRNLVKLLGCCIHEDEKMLIYEYMPNKSLDNYIFDRTKRKLLDWQMRKHIIYGIARGLLYLHQDSRLRIIHRDLKASNILLDNEMNPKISDFGLARIFGRNQTEAKTNRIVGTYGYISPEYAVDGHFSVKSDIFSFGVLVLEIVSGKRNRGFCHPEHDHNLLGHAWMLWNSRRASELIDECFTDSCTIAEVLRCINVALLCVQQETDDRPNMSSVVMMLGSEFSLPQPKQPGFFTGRNPTNADSSSKHESFSANEASLTSLEAR